MIVLAAGPTIEADRRQKNKFKLEAPKTNALRPRSVSSWSKLRLALLANRRLLETRFAFSSILRYQICLQLQLEKKTTTLARIWIESGIEKSALINRNYYYCCYYRFISPPNTWNLPVSRWLARSLALQITMNVVGEREFNSSLGSL